MKKNRRSWNMSWMRSMNFWLVIVAITVGTSGYIGGEVGFYIFAATCISLIIGLTFVDRLPGPVPTKKPYPMELIGGQLKYPRIHKEE